MRRFLRGQVIEIRGALLLAFLLLAGCTTTTRPSLGETVTLKPGWAQLERTAVRALHDPRVWAPLMTAALLQIDDLDHEISDQLREHTPLFGSTDDALDAGDDLRDLTEVTYIATGLLAPGPEAGRDWLVAKGKLIGSQWLAVESGRQLVAGIKDIADRERPNARNSRSFPSSHTTSTLMRAQFATTNIGDMQLSEATRRNLGLSLQGVAALTGWARVEAGEHYPADVLTSWALGHLFSYLAMDFIAPERQRPGMRPRLNLRADGIDLVVEF